MQLTDRQHLPVSQAACLVDVDIKKMAGEFFTRFQKELDKRLAT